MIAPIIGLVSFVLALSLLLLSLNFDTTWSWQVKAGAIIVTMLTVAISYFAMYGMLGWPTIQDIPGDMRLLAADIVEPKRGSNEKGAIYIWVKPLGKSKTSPRAYELPYDPGFHDMIMTALERADQGIQQGMQENPEYDKSVIGEDRGFPLNFFDVKPLRLPEKTDKRLVK